MTTPAKPYPNGLVRVVIVDDHDLVREGLVRRLAAVPDLEVVGEAATAAAVAGQIERLKPDVVVLDVSLPDGSGLDLCRHVTSISPTTRCVLHTGTPIDDSAARRSGAAAVVLKELNGNKLVAAVIEAAATIET